MQNARFLIYLFVVGLVFLGLAAIKMVLPHSEPKKPVDVIGMELYRPIFFSTASDEKSEAKTKEPTQTEFQDPDIDAISKSEESKPSQLATEKPAPKKTNLAGEDYFEQLIETYKNTTLKKKKYRNDVVVRYYKHEPDGDRAQVLVDYGFYLHERPVSNKKEYENVMSNVIYYGQDFPKSDLQLITYLLIQNGVEIKEVRQFKDFDGWKRKAIEIGASHYLQDDPVLSAEKIRAITD